MRDPQRIAQVIYALQAAWEDQPDLRLGQLLVNAQQYTQHPHIDLFYLEDDQWLDGLRQYLVQNQGEARS